MKDLIEKIEKVIKDNTATITVDKVISKFGVKS